MSKSLARIKRVNKLFSQFIDELGEYNDTKELHVTPEVLAQEKILVKEIVALTEWEFMQDKLCCGKPEEF